MQSRVKAANPTLWGLIALVVVLIAGSGLAFVYISPPGEAVVTFFTRDAASVRPGDSVRIAGISVGKVKDLSPEEDRVRIRAAVDGTAFVGNQSQVEVRMLTIVGGYFVNIVSLGDEPLGHNAIPVERVRMPYNLVQTLSDGTDLARRLHTKPINQSLNELQQGLSGDNVDSLSAVLDAGNGLTDAIERQHGQVTKILDMSREYVAALAGYRTRLQELIRKAAILEQTLVIYGKGFAAALTGMGAIGSAIEPAMNFVDAHRDKFLQKVQDWQIVVRAWAQRSGAMVQWLRGQRDWMERILDAQNARPELLATDLCVPIPGSPC